MTEYETENIVYTYIFTLRLEGCLDLEPHFLQFFAIV